MTISKINGIIVLPAYNEQSVISTTIKHLKRALSQLKKYRFKIVVVDDGSTDNTFALARKSADVVLRHRFNRGLGAALATGLEYARRHQEFSLAVTFDSDGQHYPQDIIRVIKPLEQKFDVVIGSRFLKADNKIPFFRKLILKISNLATFIFFAVWTTDSQSGFRAFNRRAIDLIKLTSNKMEVSSEFFAEIKRNKLRFTEIPISVRYTPYSLAKGQTNLNSFHILLKLIYKLFR
jgi:glycosyltransferase involved in cell wall biosynthesis